MPLALAQHRAQTLQPVACGRWALHALCTNPQPALQRAGCCYLLQELYLNCIVFDFFFDVFIYLVNDTCCGTELLIFKK
jgi:hypothetical protein